MSELRFHGRSTPNGEMSTELYFPSDGDVGDGQYSVSLQPSALTLSEPLTSDLVEVVDKRKVFRVLATVNPDKSFEIRLVTPVQAFHAKLKMPADTDTSLPHSIEVHLTRSVATVHFDKVRIATL